MNQRPPVSEQDIVYLPVSGIVEEIRPMDGYGQTSECSQMITLRIGEEPDTSSLEQENETEEVGCLLYTSSHRGLFHPCPHRCLAVALTADAICLDDRRCLAVSAELIHKIGRAHV